MFTYLSSRLGYTRPADYVAVVGGVLLPCVTIVAIIIAITHVIVNVVAVLRAVFVVATRTPRSCRGIVARRS